MKKKLTWKEVREKAGLSSVDMAHELGISRQLYQMKESYKRPMRVEQAVVMARLAGVELTDVKVK